MPRVNDLCCHLLSVLGFVIVDDRLPTKKLGRMNIRIYQKRQAENNLN